MIVLGIDPGIKGGWAQLTDGVLTEWGRMPTLKVRSKTIINSKLLAREFTWPDVAVVELVSGRPGQAGVFSFGHSTGSATACAMIMSNRMEWVAPQVWKKHFGLSSDKRSSLDAARMKFGEQPRLDWSVLANDGIAEAALMAQWYLDKNSHLV